MADESVDDMYEGCTSEMYNKVNNYLDEELKLKSTNFKPSWDMSKAIAKASYDKRECVDEKLTLNHFYALFTYTGNTLVYSEFTNAVRTDKKVYTSLKIPKFNFHALHFLLSDAIRLLKINQQASPHTEEHILVLTVE